MRLRRWALKGFVVDAPQFNDKLVPFNACYTRAGAEKEAAKLNNMVAMYGYKIRFKVVKL